MDLGIIGNCKSAALIDSQAKVVWACLPDFDSPSAFASLLDPKGGYFSVETPSSAKITQKYLPATNILQTTFDDGENAFAVIDFMPRYREGTDHLRSVEIFRYLKPLKGSPQVKVKFEPKLNYAKGETVLRKYSDFIRAINGVEDLFLYSDMSLEHVLNQKAFTLKKDHFLLMTYHEKVSIPKMDYVYEQFQKTKQYWENWSSNCRLPGYYDEEVLRSALVLKLLTYEDTGAVIAAVTTSLPEVLGEERNWDYRFCWLRDASLMLEALKSIGHFEEARSFIRFLLRILESKQSTIQIVYGIRGSRNLEEKILDYWEGYKSSKPVRIGNHAWTMKQNDIFGEVVHAIYLYYFHYKFEKITEEVWSLVKFLVATILRDWKSEDAGIWEYRQQKAHFTFSKMLSWVALDRGVRIAKSLNKEYISQEWAEGAAEVRQDIERKGWNAELQSYTQAYGDKNFDASLLTAERYGFLKCDDTRWISTVQQTANALMKNRYVFRYVNKDDFGRPKSAFIVATLWMAKALFSIGEKQKARDIFEHLLSKSNSLGLLSEDIDPQSGELLGNFPQAYSHMAVINTANLLAKN